MSRPPFPLWALGRGLLCGALVASDLHAQDSLPPWEGGLTASLGQPTRLRFYAGGTFGLDWRRGYATGPAAYGQFGVTRSLLGPDVGLLAASVEAFGGLRSAEGDGGARVLLQLPVLRLALGGEYNFRDDPLGVALGLPFPVRAGGGVSRGHARADRVDRRTAGRVADFGARSGGSGDRRTNPSPHRPRRHVPPGNEVRPGPSSRRRAGTR